MNNNRIDKSGVTLFNGEIFRDPGNPGKISILISDEYIKAVNYQKEIRERGTFHIGGNLLYQLLSDLFDYISELFNRIRLDDVDIHDEENRTLLFLKKFSRSSERISSKIENRQKEYQPKGGNEIFPIHINVKDDNIHFSRTAGNQSKIFIDVPSNFLYNRLISFVDSMEFQDLKRLEPSVHSSFMNNFSDLNRRVSDKKKHIDMRYAIQLAQGRIADLERENQELHSKISFFTYQNKLYKRSYFQLKKRFDRVVKKQGSQDNFPDEELEEI